MPTSSKKDFVKYTKGFGPYWLIAVGVLVVLYFVHLVISTDPAGVPLLTMALISLIPIGLSIWLIWRGISYLKKYTACVQEAESSGELQAILADFSRSHSMMRDGIRLGEKYIYSKGGGYPVSYGEIESVYQAIIRRNFVESERRLNAVVSGGKVRTLCNLKLRGKSDEDVLEIMDYIQQRNPRVQLGNN